LVASLPSKWSKKYGLKGGDEVEVIEQGKNLLISTMKEVAGDKKTITIKSPAEFLNRFIRAPYCYGYEEVEVRFSDPAVLPLINEYLNLLLGFEIVDQGEGYVVIQMVAKGMEGDFDKILRRFMMILCNMSKEIPEAIRKKDKNMLVQIMSMESITNKLSNFCERMLNKNGYEDIKKTNFLFCFCWSAEQISDSMKEICSLMLEKDAYRKGTSEDTLGALSGFSGLLESYSRLFYNPSNEGMVSFKKDYMALEKDIYGMISSRSEDEKRILFNILKMTDLLRHLSISLI